MMHYKKIPYYGRPASTQRNRNIEDYGITSQFLQSSVEIHIASSMKILELLLQANQKSRPMLDDV